MYVLLLDFGGVMKTLLISKFDGKKYGGGSNLKQ